MAGWLPNNPFKSRFIEQRINKFSTLQPGDNKHHLISSPAWENLQNGPSRVKKLSKLFEEKSSNFNTRKNSVIEEEAVICSSPDSRKQRTKVHKVCDDRSCTRSLNNNNSPGKLMMTSVDRIASELVHKELSYIQALERGIDCYVKAIRMGGEEVPHELRDQTFKVFGNIEEIFKLHKESVYPRLIICNGDVKLMAETITSFVQNDLFYCYVNYAINQKYADQLVTLHYAFFESMRRTSDDLLGINSFTIQPIQKLPRYKMLFDEMIKALSNDVLTNKETIAACCVAEKSVQRLLNRLNQVLSINDIVEINEFGVSVQMSLLTTMQNSLGIKIDEPLMLLVPKTSPSFPFRSPFNIYDLGKFLKTETFKAHELSGLRKFQSKVFIFEKCLLYTKIIREGTLGYRNHFSFRSGFAFTTKEYQTSFRVSGLNKKQDVIFSSNNIESIAEMKRLINQFYDPRRSNDSAFVDGNELMICEDHNDEGWLLTD